MYMSQGFVPTSRNNHCSYHSYNKVCGRRSAEKVEEPLQQILILNLSTKNYKSTNNKNTNLEEEKKLNKNRIFGKVEMSRLWNILQYSVKAEFWWDWEISQ